MSLFLLPMAAVGLAANCMAAPTSTFTPSQSSTGLSQERKASTDDIQILAGAPTENVVILGELSFNGQSGASFHDQMVVALGEAMDKGADFVALAGTDTRAGLVLGKMVPSGHGRSMFVAGPLLGSEVGRIATIPPDFAGSVRVVLGRYSNKAT
jgi:hypothetical protein